MIVHQVFGLLGDSNFPDLFKICSKKMRSWCRQQGYRYKLWDKKMCDRLIKKYPDYEEMYNNVKYPIMKVDIIRFLILHSEGGLYCDLDIEPHINLLKDDEFIVSTYKKNGKKYFNMEVLQSIKGNQLCLDYLNYVASQIEKKNSISVYDTWKIRYVLQTTGPRSLTRFVKNKAIDVSTYNVNNSTTHPDRMNLEGQEDFISYPSGTWIVKN